MNMVYFNIRVLIRPNFALGSECKLGTQHHYDGLLGIRGVRLVFKESFENQDYALFNILGV